MIGFLASDLQAIAEVIGTYFLIFTGCGSVAVNKIYGSVTFPGICAVWGLIVMVMIYSVGHISGAHFNPAVTITFAIFRHFPRKQASFSYVQYYYPLKINSNSVFPRIFKFVFPGRVRILTP